MNHLNDKIQSVSDKVSSKALSLRDLIIQRTNDLQDYQAKTNQALSREIQAIF